MTERPGPEPTAIPPEMIAGLVIGFIAGVIASEALPWRR